MTWFLLRVFRTCPPKPVHLCFAKRYRYDRRNIRVSSTPLLGRQRAETDVKNDVKPFQILKRTLRLDAMPEKKEFERLPKTVTPLHYDLFLKPNLKTLDFVGKETVQIKIHTPTSSIVLNSLELAIKSAGLELNGRVLTPKVNLSQEDETLTLEFTEPLPAGEASLMFEFSGELNDKMKGFYRSNISSVEGEPLWAAVTQFEPTDARRCFPCWDEPAIKSVFDITVSAPKDKVALSNMPMASEQMEGDQRVVKFLQTPVMSTYLVAVVVGDFDHVEDTSEDGVLVRVYTPVGVKEQGRFALHVATKVLPFYKDYFQIAYPLPKIDLVAIADFSAGAMENWGLVTYRQSCLLVDPENTSASRKQWIAIVVGHELAHQWFGNLVTMEWWTHLWLNEGYATFVENLCVAHLFPEYDIWTQFVSDMFIRALELDCLKNSHPIEVPVGHPSEIDEIFDDISYNKGASVIRMLHRYIGDADFRKGMHLYLTRHQYSNTFTEDLWAALEEASKKPVRAVMSTWTKQMGFPVIRVVSSEQEGNCRVLKVAQEKFCADIATKNDSSLWMVPLTFSAKGRENEVIHSVMLEGKSATISIPDIEPNAWVKLNPGTVGVYRVSYPQCDLDRLIPAIKDMSLPPLDRLGLVDDLFALVQAGRCTTVQVLQVISAMQNEDNFTVWSIIANCLGKVSALLSNTDQTDNFKKFGVYLFKTIGDKLGWEPKPQESHLDTLLRSLVLSRLGWYGDEDTIKEAKRRFKAHVTGEHLIPADLRAAVYKTVLSVGNQDTYNSMLKLYRDESLQEEKDRILRSLGAIGDKKILTKVLEFTMSDEVRSQDKVFVVISVAMTKVGRELAWEFLKTNWVELLNRYEGGFLLPRLVKHTMEDFASEEMAKEIEDFFANKDTSAAERSIQQSVETILLNAAWLKRDIEDIQMFLKKWN
ncbi:puromycin-sensitive aminopeptidase [Cimex lectularius]|uniref:Aminopeptidase n=1 Tax=Cimex lectularius TaxID=79782 RepID=A0A8I6RC05_CIMLE|nr:puromycin-sensitive aminopeptidase [Cimex lectularius]